MTIFLVFAAVLVVSLLSTRVLRRYALAQSLMDIPNGRSSHSVPTPRGGGLAIVLTYLAALGFMASAGLISGIATWPVLGSGALIALVGFLDDHGHIAARWRLLAHFCAAAWALLWIGGLPTLPLAGYEVSLGWLGHLLAAMYLVWVLNLYNFMDGIDGIASIEAVCVCLGASLVYWLTGHNELILAPILLASAVLGFLYWNFPPARIFMGDAGSGFLGIVIGVLSLQAAWVAGELLWVWLILLGVFIVDATFTLGRRLLRGDKVYEAHRSHAYQYASRKAGRHMPVTLGVMAINIFWLIPIGICVGLGFDGLFGVVLAYVPLVLLAVKFHAGELEKTK
ncbi:MraY family glycosyltransferase [Pseudomonas lurida]|uniref:MraY family glycosyltransferase n=1 Tax=Pseudomonas lurida TaxID=244566 RepID=UPI000BF410BD|nr:glycosyltransferase family 4 protein [Pseudomonas lurida]MBC3236653.1 glycosyltransferase family 4 protein [Pseudomonas lurida]PFG23024.1 Fuc2NAc and GlcNAc transferase [Pseudomonas lurida]